MNICEHELRCEMKDRYCKCCKHNPNAELVDHFSDRGYEVSCKYGYDDCISDPARRGNKGICEGCDEGSWYDDEDK